MEKNLQSVQSTWTVVRNFTRAKADPFNKNMCFFCQTISNEETFNLRSYNAGIALERAVNESGNDKWRMQLNTAISPSDAHAIDVNYHRTSSVKNVQRGQCNVKQDDNNNNVHLSTVTEQVAALTELMHILDKQTAYKKYLAIEDVKKSYLKLYNFAIENHVLTIQ